MERNSMDVDDSTSVHCNEGKSHKAVGQRNSIKKLQSLVHELEVNNDLPPSPRKEENRFLIQTNGHMVIGKDDNMNNNDRYSLENVEPISEFEMDTEFESEDSWLFESPIKVRTPGEVRSPDKWLKDNISTPELMRIRGSLSAKMDVIAIESRKVLDRSSVSGGSRRESQDRRRISRHSRRGSGASVHSLDWDYDEAKRHSNTTSNLTNEDLSFAESGGYSPQYGSNPELSELPDEPSELVGLSKTNRNKQAADSEKPFTLDWSDDEDLKPMQLNFNSNSTQNSARRAVQVAPNPTVVRRGPSGLSEPRTTNYDHDEFTVIPTGGVKPRRGLPNVSQDITDYRSQSPGSDDFDMNAPVVPRGSKKAWQASKSRKIKFADEPIILEEDHYDNTFTYESPVPRGSTNIAKPVQRRAPESGSRLKAPGSASNLVKPRSSQSIAKSRSTSDLPVRQDEFLKVSLPSDNGVVRRRGPGSTDSVVPQPRKSKDPNIARVQGSIPQVRRSTGSISTKSESGIARPRRSQSPGSIVRPRGQPSTTQSYQTDY